jgi:hypothetical protein
MAMKALPKLVESGWLVTGPDRDVTYLANVSLRVDEGMWLLAQRVNLGRDEERSVTEHASEAAARAHLEQVYAAGEEHGRWRKHYWP